MTRVAAGLMLCAPLPAMYGRLRRSAMSYDAPTPTDVAAARTTAVAATLPERTAVAPVVSVVENRPSDPPPVVTPQGAKAGGIRRAVQGTPCHDCRCCEAYSPRLADAQVEIDQLRAELVTADGNRLNHRRIDPAPFSARAVAGAS